MKKQKAKFVLAEATLSEINKQLKVNVLVIGMLVIMLLLNTVRFMKAYSLFYGALIAIMLFLLLMIMKSRKLLKLRQQQLTK